MILRTLIFLMICLPAVLNAHVREWHVVSVSNDSVSICSDSAIVHLSAKEMRREKLVSAMLAFPFPFGFIGAHRVMLGCKPWVPVVYVATFGGCFGLLPLIDFSVILFSKDLTEYENNPRIFMWVK